jgi:hypothetical protein
MKYLLIFLILTSSPKAIAQNIEKDIKHTVSLLVAAGCAFIASKGYAHWVVYNAQIQFAPERELLNHYAYYSNGNSWTTNEQALLKRDLKDRIVHMHNTNRNRWSCNVLYDICTHKPAVYIDKQYETYPLLQHMQHLKWYIKRLKIIRFLHLYPNHNELNLLIDQLVYIKQMLLSDEVFNEEERFYTLTKTA